MLNYKPEIIFVNIAILIATKIVIVRGLLEKYPTVFFYANTWLIII